MPKKKKAVSTPNAALAILHIRLPADEKRAFMKAAEAAHFNLTLWVRLGLRKLAGLDKR